MGNEGDGESFLGALAAKMRRQKADAPQPPVRPVMAMLDRLLAGERPDFCLYLRPPGAGAFKAAGLLAVDLEQLLPAALHPLAMLVLDETGGAIMNAPLPDESFLLLANCSRLLCVAPTNHSQSVKRVRMTRSLGPMGRTIFIMPEAGTLGAVDWPTTWPTAKAALAPLGINLSDYTAGGWLFRVDKQGQAVTFRPIVNPNPEKIARALEGVCSEME